jgi:large subunit ribosomal protein L14e
MIEIGRLCAKIAGRDAGKIGVVIDIVDDNYVMIDGQTRRRKCNLNHLEIINKVIEIKKNASHSEIISAFKELNIDIKESKEKTKKDIKERPRKQKKVRTLEQETKKIKSEIKKEIKPKEDKQQISESKKTDVKKA